MMKKIFVLAILVCCIGFTAIAQPATLTGITTATIGLSVATPQASVLKIPLYKLAPVTSVDLKCINSSYEVALPVPGRWEIKKAALSLKYANSTNLIAERSQLVVRLNDAVVGQARLNPLSPEGRLNLIMPVHMLVPGYNRLSFHVAQHYSKDCEQPCAPDLWTTLNFYETFLEIEYDWKPVPLNLSAVSDFLFDPKIFPHGEVNIVTEGLSLDTATVAGIVASGIAMKFDYRKVLFSISHDLKPGVDNILIGGNGFVETFLKQKGIGINKISGPFLKIMHMPDNNGVDAGHALLVLAGANLGHVKQVAETLAYLTFPYPGTDEMTPLGLDLPEIPLYSGRLVLTPDKVYRFKDLGFNTFTFKGFNPNPKELIFRLPPDFHIKQNQNAVLTLNFSYGAGLRSDSLVNIILNGTNIKAIHLKNQSGDYIEGYKLDLPTYLFRPGTNKLIFSPAMSPMVKECDLLQPEALFFTLFENSSLHFPPMPHFIELPKMELFVLNGFPFTRRADGGETTIYITRSDADVIASALNLIGLITQKNGFPLIKAKINLNKPKGLDGDLIIIGDINSIPEDLKENSPLKLREEGTVPYPVSLGWESEQALASSRQISNLGEGKGIIVAFQSPFKRGRSVLLFTASSAKELLNLSTALLEPAVQGNIKGDLVVVDLTRPDYKVTSLDTGQKYYAGEMGKISIVEYYLHMYPVLYYISLTVFILVASFILFFLLKKARSRRFTISSIVLSLFLGHPYLSVPAVAIDSDIYLGSEWDTEDQSFSYLGGSVSFPVDQRVSAIGRVFSGYLRYKFKSADRELMADVLILSPAVGVRFKSGAFTLTATAGLDLRDSERETTSGGDETDSDAGLTFQGEVDYWGEGMKNAGLLASYSTIDDFFWMRGRAKKKFYEIRANLPLLVGAEAATMGNSDFSANQVGVVVEVINTATDLSVLVKGGYKDTSSFGGSGYGGIELYYRFR